MSHSITVRLITDAGRAGFLLTTEVKTHRQGMTAALRWFHHVMAMASTGVICYTPHTVEVSEDGGPWGPVAF